MYGLSPPGADWAGPAATPGSGVSFATLNMFAPPSWRAARGLAPTQPNTTPGRESACAPMPQPSASMQLINATMKKLGTSAETAAIPPGGKDVPAPGGAYLAAQAPEADAAVNDHEQATA